MVSGGEVSSGATRGSCAHNKLTLVVIQQSTVGETASSVYRTNNLRWRTLQKTFKTYILCTVAPPIDVDEREQDNKNQVDLSQSQKLVRA